jgi:hypothetical protein
MNGAFLAPCRACSLKFRVYRKIPPDSASLNTQLPEPGFMIAVRSAGYEFFTILADGSRSLICGAII